MVWLILASGASVVGGLIVVFNWYSIYASRRYGRFVSPIPIAGAVCLVAGLCGFDMTRSYAWIGVIVDYGTMSLVFVGIPVIVIQAWEVSRLNLLHSFAADVAGRRYEIRLFRRAIATIKCEYEPPALCNDFGARCRSIGFVGRWHEQGDGFCIEGFAEDRVVWLRDVDGCYRTVESNYPSDAKYPYDKLDGLRFRKLK